ncbi:MAG TPA: hypothetical protein VEC09_06545, partial [Actinomycetota bacterium]|nr:hypothetical protein [Actinomycetota bacterium]
MNIVASVVPIWSEASASTSGAISPVAPAPRASAILTSSAGSGDGDGDGVSGADVDGAVVGSAGGRAEVHATSANTKTRAIASEGRGAGIEPARLPPTAGRPGVPADQDELRLLPVRLPPDRFAVDFFDDERLAVDFFDDERLAVDFLRDVDFFDPPEELDRFEDDRFEEEDFFEPPPDDLPPRLEAPGEFAIFAARSFDMPLSRSPSYC